MADEQRNELDGRGGGTQVEDEDAATKAKAAEEEQDDAKREMEELEEGDPPENLEDWPSGKAKYETFGGPEGPHTYQEGPEEKLGPSGVRHHEDGSVTIDGEAVDNPDEFKGDPIPGGPTDPNATGVPGEKKENLKGGDSDDDGGDDG